MCHSDHDVAIHPGDYNKPGCNDPDLDAAVRTIITSLDHEEKLAAAYLAQEILYNENYPNAAFSYMQLYSRILFDGYNPDLRGIVNSPGYCSNNGWTYFNIHWAPGTERYEGDETIIEWLGGGEPELLNPCSAGTGSAWLVINPTLDGLMAVNPYTHEDLPWMATNWDAETWPDAGGPGVDWMNVTFYLDPAVFWQDGYPFTADDAAFSWNFLKTWEVPRYLGMTMWLEDVEVLDTYTVRAILNTTSQFLLYDLARTAALLPPQVWDRTWTSLQEIMQYDPANDHTDTGGPWFGAGTGFPDTRLFGTGPFVFEYYNPILMVADLHQFAGYHKPSDQVSMMKTEMFHKIGDVNYDGYINVFDLAALGAAYGARIGWPRYNPNADVNSDGICNGRDLALITWHWGEQKEHPEP
jgi:ABC-type transport system substrate-binding protein